MPIFSLKQWPFQHFSVDWRMQYSKSGNLFWIFIFILVTKRLDNVEAYKYFERNYTQDDDKESFIALIQRWTESCSMHLLFFSFLADDHNFHLRIKPCLTRLFSLISSTLCLKYTKISVHIERTKCDTTLQLWSLKKKIKTEVKPWLMALRAWVKREGKENDKETRCLSPQLLIY